MVCLWCPDADASVNASLFSGFEPFEGASAEMGMRLPTLREQLIEHWNRWKDGEIERSLLRQHCQRIRAEFEQTLRQVVELGHE